MSQQDASSNDKDLEDLEHQFRQDWNHHAHASFQSHVSGTQVLRKIKFRTYRAMAMSLAASLLLGFGIWAWVQQQSMTQVEQKLNRSLAWLKREQLPEGKWDTVKWGGKERFTVGVSSLAMMSIMQLEGSSDSKSIHKTINYLQSQQSDSGLIGPEFLGDLYNHSLATLALKKARSMGMKVSDDIIRKAEAHLLKFKTKDGFYAYRLGMSAEKNLSEWATLALQGGEKYDLQWPQVQKSHSTTFSKGVQSHQRLDAMDLFFKQLSQPEVSKEARTLIEFQEDKGELAGSWPVEGKWSHVGGRVFTTGMAILCVKPLII